MATYLVTGCAGFIGSALAARLLAAGHTVTGVDVLSAYYSPLLKQRRLERLLACEQFCFVQQDVADAGRLDDLFRHSTIDAVLHLAAVPGVRSSVLTPAAYFRTNTAGTLELLECCRRYGVGQFLLASTSAVYGNSALPFQEDRPAEYVLSPYAASKKAAEALCYTYHHLYGINVCILRYFSVYGPSGRPDMAVPLFIRDLLADRPVTLLGDGLQQRDFTFIDDIVEGTVRALDLPGCTCLNLGSGRTSTLLDVVHLIGRYTGRRVEVHHLAAHPADARTTLADITRAGALLGWSPGVGIEEGLRRTVDWYMRL